jgi:hypothetical protein
VDLADERKGSHNPGGGVYPGRSYPPVPRSRSGWNLGDLPHRSTTRCGGSFVCSSSCVSRTSATRQAIRHRVCQRKSRGRRRRRGPRSSGVQRPPPPHSRRRVSSSAGGRFPSGRSGVPRWQTRGPQPTPARRPAESYTTLARRPWCAPPLRRPLGGAGRPSP